MVGVGVEAPDFTQLEGLAAALSRTFRVSCGVDRDWVDAVFAYNPQRGQYWSTAILERLAGTADGTHRLLGVAPVDLFVPVLTFVFGEAQLTGVCAVVSYSRLSEEAYGLPAHPELVAERLLKEAVHELGHTFGLRHCDDWRCVMASSHSVERLDTKTSNFCERCARAVFSL